ncbi:MAG: hypothetical protein WCI72_05115 [archaeon]
MSKGLSEQEAKAWTVIIAIVIVGLGILILKIKIGLIHFAQNMFWVSFVLMLLALFLLIVFLIWGIFKQSDNQGDSWAYSEPEFFDKTMIFVFAGGFFVLSLVSFVGMPYFYERGYSDQALQNLAEYENQLQSLEQLQSVLTGQIVWDIQNQVMEETITNLCKDPNYPCDQIKQSYETYKAIKGMKDNADNLMNFFGFVEKAKQVYSENSK